MTRSAPGSGLRRLLHEEIRVWEVPEPATVIGEAPAPWVDGRWMPTRHVFVMLVCRSGRIVPGPGELFWVDGVAGYGNHLGAADSGDTSP